MGVTFILDDNRKMRMPDVRMSEEDFFNLCAANPELPLERDRNGNVLLMPPTGYEDGCRESTIIVELSLWNRRTKAGHVFSSNTGFTLSNGAVRSPDGGWISNERHDALDANHRERFAHIAPDFVAEVMSRTDSGPEARRKMEEYIECGVRLGFLGLHTAKWLGCIAPTAR